MASSILLALSKDKNNIFYINDHNKNNLERMKKELGNRVIVSNYKEILNNCSYVFLGVKPQDLTSLLEEIKDYIKDTVIVSMAAGFNIEDIIKISGEIKLVRIMPNTPVLIGKGVTFFTKYNVSLNDINDLVKTMLNTGEFLEIEEDKMDLVSVLTGSAPAYLDYFIDALAEFGNKLGLSKQDSIKYVLKMVEGTIALDLISSKAPLELGKEVCSPGGSTIEGVNTLLDNGIYHLIESAGMASYKKTKNMKIN